MALGTDGDVDSGDSENQLLPGFVVVHVRVGEVGILIEELLAQDDASVATGVRKKTIVSDAHESGRQEVKEKSPEELVGVKGHVFELVALGSVAPSERNLVVVDRLDTVVGEGNAVCVATEVAQNLFGTGKRWLAVDDPVVARSATKTSVAVGTGPTERARVESLFELLEELASEDPGEDTDKEQESGFGRDPSVVVSGAESPTGNDAVEVRVEVEGLGPCMEDRREADAGAEVLGS